MNKEQLKECLIRDKLFLKELYESDNQGKSKRILQSSDDAQISTLLKYFHFLSNGEIKIKKVHFDSVDKRYLVHIKKNFEKKAVLKNLMKNSRKEKLKVLLKLSPKFAFLLAPLFNQ